MKILCNLGLVFDGQLTFSSNMRLFVKDVFGVSVATLEIKPSDTIMDVARKLQQKTGVRSDKTRLVFGSKEIFAGTLQYQGANISLSLNLSTAQVPHTSDPVVVDGNSRSEVGVHQVNLYVLLCHKHPHFRSHTISY